MQTVKVTLELSMEQARKLFNYEDPEKLEIKKSTKKVKYSNEELAGILTEVETELKEMVGPTKRTPGEGRGFAPKLPVKTMASYRAQPGDSSGRIGRPSALNLEGMKAVWDFYQDGHSVPEIAFTFREILGTEAVRRLIKRIARSGNKD
jgi:hypothetical protein